MLSMLYCERSWRDGKRAAQSPLSSPATLVVSHERFLTVTIDVRGEGRSGKGRHGQDAPAKSFPPSLHRVERLGGPMKPGTAAADSRLFRFQINVVFVIAFVMLPVTTTVRAAQVRCIARTRKGYGDHNWSDPGSLQHRTLGS